MEKPVLMFDPSLGTSAYEQQLEHGLVPPNVVKCELCNGTGGPLGMCLNCSGMGGVLRDPPRKAKYGPVQIVEPKQ